MEMQGKFALNIDKWLFLDNKTNWACEIALPFFLCRYAAISSMHDTTMFRGGDIVEKGNI